MDNQDLGVHTNDKVTPERLQDTRYIKYAEQKRNARNDRITVKYPA
jgi:hypothetical protein